MNLITFAEYGNSLPELPDALHCWEAEMLSCDSRYRSLITQLDAMIKTVKEQQSFNLQEAMDRFLLDLREHIAAENSFMDLVGYPQTYLHRLHHLFIRTCGSDLAKRANLESNPAAADLIYVRMLLIGHFLVQDRAFEDYLTHGKSTS